MRITAKIAATLSVLLASCNSGDAVGPDPRDKSDALEPGMMPPWWKASDACSIIDKATMSGVLKQAVAAADVSLVHEPTATEAATSECRYAGADGGVLATLMTRWSPVRDNSSATISEARSAAGAAAQVFGATVEDVPGLGKAAFFVPKADQLTVFLDDARMVTVTVTRAPEGATGKDLAITLARKAGAREN